MNSGTAYVYGAVRTPRGRGHALKGALRDIRPMQLAETCFRAIGRTVPDIGVVEEVVLGCSTATGEQGSNIARIAALYAGWPASVNGVTVSSFCTSGLEAVQTAAMKVMTGSARLVAAGGVESMSRLPMFADRGAWFSDPEVARRTGFVHMGLSAEAIAHLGDISRDDLDAWALRSHRLAADLQVDAEYMKYIVPVTDGGKSILDRDEGVRYDLTPEMLQALPPIFHPEDHREHLVRIRQRLNVDELIFRHTVATSPGLADAASLLLIGDESAADFTGAEPIARLTGFASAAVDPVIMLTGVVDATLKLLDKQGLNLSEIDLFEVNESFASVPLYFIRETGVDPGRVNIGGGALALGHPLGATGGILLGTLISHLRRTGGRRGVATICGGAGIAQATLVEVD